MKVAIVYWSGTGNTQQMAQNIALGAKDAGAEVELKNVTQASIDDVLNADIAALGCSSMGDEVLEESEFEPFVTELEGKVGGKKLALFGSYGWGDGQWMRDWVERMQNAGAEIIGGEGLIINETPDADGDAQCKALGAKLAG